MRKINTQNFKRATRSTARQINRQIALNLVREHQPISRADLARRMGIGRGMVTSLINELLEEGSVYEGATVDAPRGRRPQMLHVRTRDRLVVAVDVRFSRTYLMLGDFSGREIALETFETLFEPSALIQELAGRISRLLRTHGSEEECHGIGLVVPGMVDRESGRVLNSPQLGWRDVDIRDELSTRTGLPVQVENAPIACALAQMWLGQQKGHGPSNFVYVTVSDGVGAGIVIDGEVVRGHGHTAGEFGHISITPDGPRCLCGSRGCWEAYTSNLATLSRYFGHEMSPEEARHLVEESTLTITELIARARSGDAKARAAIEETGRYLATGVAMIVNALNPTQIFVGGEITAAWDLIEGKVRAAVREHALTKAAAATPIIPEQIGGYPRLRGAMVLIAGPVFAAPQVA
jgi:predicted NBD/HSP70 family sugar kinase